MITLKKTKEKWLYAAIRNPNVTSTPSCLKKPPTESEKYFFHQTNQSICMKNVLDIDANYPGARGASHQVRLNFGCF